MGERVKSWTFGGANALDYFSEEGFKKFQDTVEEKGYTLEGLGWEGGATEPAATEMPGEEGPAAAVAEA